MTQVTRVIGLLGFAQSGKDTAAGFLAEFGFKRLAFADILRDSVYALNPIVPMPLEGAPDHWARVQDIVDWKGWDVAKVEYPEIRALLQRMGTEVGRSLYGENFWVERVTNQIRKAFEPTPGVHPRDKRFVITDVRFQNEADAIRELGGKVYKIQRPGTGAVNSHVSDAGQDSILVDAIIPNAGTLEHFREVVLSATGVN